MDRETTLESGGLEILPKNRYASIFHFIYTLTWNIDRGFHLTSCENILDRRSSTIKVLVAIQMSDLTELEKSVSKLSLEYILIVRDTGGSSAEMVDQRIGLGQVFK